MKFLYIEIENMFAYDRKVRVDLSTTTSQKNLVLVWGRNGMGKTSFLNCVKLLFLGAEDRDMRKVGFPPISLQHRQYVLGDGPRWSGVINRRARHRAQSSGVPAVASVSAQWAMPDGQVVTATRSWTTSDAGYVESLTVSDGEALLSGEPALERLEDFVPREFVNYFFFDGEEIKRLAESEGIDQSNFDRLLRITFIDELAQEVRKYATERGRGAAFEELRRAIRASEDALARAERLRADARTTLDRIEPLRAVDEAELRRLTTRKENLSGGASEAQRNALEKRQREIKGDLEEEEARIFERAPADAPILANLALVRSAEAMLSERLSAVGEGERKLASKIDGQLGHWIEEAPVPLEPTDRVVLRDMLSQRINALATPRETSGVFGRLDPLRAQQILQELQRWFVAGDDIRSSQLIQLAQVRRYRRELTDLREELVALEVGSQANLEQYMRITASIEALELQIADHNQKIGQEQRKLEEAHTIEQNHIDRLVDLRRQEEAELRTQNEAQFVLRASTALADLREALRSTLRGHLEKALNGRFQTLVHQHQTIDRIEIDESYTMSFYNRSNERIGRASLSSGLKQLAATALLWALKDTSGIDMPVIIDTPLGRIDRGNQNRMLLDYYPQLSHQVIVLPTDAEVDEDKFRSLQHCVAAQYVIDNAFGDGADIIANQTLLRAGAHG
jgi:DNA sulfur modification protein DndD